jgi:hypothetical protein
MNDYTSPDAHDAREWQSLMDYANDQARPGWGHRDQRHACGNPNCDQLCASLFCSEVCRTIHEGPDHEDPEEPVAALCTLPEAPASATVRLTIAGHEGILFTIRDRDELALLGRLERLLARFPVPEKNSQIASSAVPQCPTHGVPMKLNHGKDGSTWYSHKVGDTWCKGRR